MSFKTLVWIFFFVGSTLGSFLPLLFNKDLLSLWGILGSAMGGIVGIWIAYKLSEH